MPGAKDFDLSTVDGFVRAVEWIRNNIVLTPAGKKSKVLQLDVRLSQQDQVTLFMRTDNHYILGFRGTGETVFLLADDSRNEFREMLIDDGLAKREQLQDIDLGGDHRSLRTLRDPSGKQRTFAMKDLLGAKHLASYSDATSSHTLKTPLAVLVCMLAEAARHPMMEWEFRRLYAGQPAAAGDAIQAYAGAIQVTRIADRHFLQYSRRSAIEKLAKRAQELTEVIARIENSGQVDASNRPAMINRILKAQMPLADPRLLEAAKRIREIAKELGIAEAEPLLEIRTAFENEAAVRAATDGVIFPPIANSPGA
jgi:hypothetical protein